MIEYSRTIAAEQGWPEKWLNTSAAKFERDAKADDGDEREIFRRRGLVVTRPSTMRLLAWKLARYADSVDVADALQLLRSILETTPYSRHSIALQLDAQLADAEIRRATDNLEDLLDRPTGGDARNLDPAVQNGDYLTVRHVVLRCADSISARRASFERVAPF